MTSPRVCTTDTANHTTCDTSTMHCQTKFSWLRPEPPVADLGGISGQHAKERTGLPFALPPALRPTPFDYIFRRYSPPTSYSACDICPPLLNVTAIRRANTLRRSRAVCCSSSREPGTPPSPAPAARPLPPAGEARNALRFLRNDSTLVIWIITPSALLEVL